MKAKVFRPDTTQHKDINKPKDYWGLLFVSLIFTALMSSFLIDSHRDNNLVTKVAHSTILTSTIDINQHTKS